MALPFMDPKLFARQKDQCLRGADLSRKGSVDAAIVDLVEFLNDQPDFFTTSSCSGRIIVVDNVSETGEVQKQGCSWLFVTHDEACLEDIERNIVNTKGEAVFKFEPMHAAAVASGFRNSGITLGGKSASKIIVAVRSTHALEVPLSSQGQLLVSSDYLQHLVHCANRKMTENLTRINRFFQNVKTMVNTTQEEGIKRKRSKQKGSKSDTSRITDAGQTKLESCGDNSKETDGSGEGRGDICSTDSDAVEDTFDCLLFEET
ncbi:hypothetical protein BaRGS_00017921 [Batillaria attramentaria]|uniref:tRNA wybutosine-synthesizing protein 3 homolog n=1 Tax=Batillaria attramentaria TaxID=370345 RepID=A0ABD0KUN6_9CAEN